VLVLCVPRLAGCRGAWGEGDELDQGAVVHGVRVMSWIKGLRAC
jgi:hypothetical protein